MRVLKILLLIGISFFVVACGGGGDGGGGGGVDCTLKGYSYNTLGQLIDTVDLGDCSCGGVLGECDIEYNGLGQKIKSCVCQ